MKAAQINIGIFAAAVLAFSLLSMKSDAQVHSPKGTISDTVTYSFYNNDLNFDAKRTVVFDDKNSVDSLAGVLATKESKNYRIIYQKEGQKARVVSAKDLRGMSNSGFYKITIAYNKQEATDETKPLYIIRAK